MKTNNNRQDAASAETTKTSIKQAKQQQQAPRTAPKISNTKTGPATIYFFSISNKTFIKTKHKAPLSTQEVYTGTTKSAQKKRKEKRNPQTH
jgi:hypothetical protein